MSRFLIAISLFLALVNLDKVYGQEQWKDITEELNGVLGGSTNEKILKEYSPLFVNTSSLRQISSVNHKGRVFKRADFSYFIYGQSYRKRIVVDCSDWFYKENDSDSAWSWVPPSEYVSVTNSGLEYIMLKHLCRDSEEPWKPFIEAEDGTKYFYNRGLKVDKSELHGDLKYIYIAKGSPNSSAKLIAYASCPKRLFALYLWKNDPGANQVDMNSVNPLSIGEGMLERMCGFPPRDRDSAPSTNNGSTIRTNETQRLVNRYQQALEAQQEMMRGLMGR